MKVKSMLLTLSLTTALFAGCAKPIVKTPKVKMPAPVTSPQTISPQATSPQATSPQTTSPQVTTPSVTTPSVTTPNEISTAAAFEKAISSNGTQIIAIKKNLTINKDLTVDGEFKNVKVLMDRKLYLYSQDKDKNIKTRFTLTVPKLTIKSTQTSIEHGTFKGDLYVTSNNFRLIDTTIKGNIYFTTDEAKSTFKMDSESKVTGKQELKK